MDVMNLLTGITAVASGIAAVGSWVSSARLNQIEQRRDEKDMEEEERSRSAGFIALGMEDRSVPPEERWSIFIHNQTGEPVFNVVIHSQNPHKRLPVKKPDLNLQCVPAGDFIVHASARFHWGVLLPFVPSEQKSIIARASGDGSSKEVVTSYEYTDLEGKQWRKREGEVCPHPDSQPAAP